MSAFRTSREVLSLFLKANNRFARVCYFCGIINHLSVNHGRRGKRCWIFTIFVDVSSMRMKSHKDNADFLHLFSQDNDGLKFLTHDTDEDFDFLNYVYKCQRLILSKGTELDISPSIFNLVRGFVFGPQWTDYKGECHHFFISSDEVVSYFERTGSHPINDPGFEKEIEAFKNSIRFRSGELNKFLLEMKEVMQPLELEVDGSVRGADMYTDTGSVREAIRLILSSMRDFNINGEHPRVSISYNEEVTPDKAIQSTITLTQHLSYPVHKLSHDMDRLKGMDAGSLGTIRKKLDGLCGWSVCSKWPDREGPDCWRILREETEAELSPISETEGFTHIISIYHRP